MLKIKQNIDLRTKFDQHFVLIEQNIDLHILIEKSK